MLGFQGILTVKSDISELSEKCSRCFYDLDIDVKGIYKLNTGNYSNPNVS